MITVVENDPQSISVRVNSNHLTYVILSWARDNLDRKIYEYRVEHNGFSNTVVHFTFESAEKVRTFRHIAVWAKLAYNEH